MMPSRRSLSLRLSWGLGLLMALGLGILSTVMYSATAMRLHSAEQETLANKVRVLREIIRVAGAKGEGPLLTKLASLEPMRAGTRLALHRADGSLLFRDPGTEAFDYQIGTAFDVPAPAELGGVFHAAYAIDTSHDTLMLRSLALTLLVTTLVGALLTAWGICWLVRRELRPLEDLAAQTRAISPQRLHQRLQLARPAEELRPWIDQFNALMQRLEQAYGQLEGFNADVAHELRTPITNLIGQTEVALSRERSVDSLRETLVSNLEEMQRLAAMVNDMLFLSHADSGAVARRGAPVSLAALARQVAEFHEASCEEAGVRLRVEGDALLAVDEPLYQRAVSNLIGNATRFAEPGSTVRICIAPDDPEHVQVAVHNAGPSIAEQHLPRLFDRFFRVDASRQEAQQQHHGLGLAIVAAIARMHAGQPLAASDGGVTRVGFTLAARQVQ